ncbi:MAG: ABC transporter substrate-binding protein [Actinomycetes bacterium]
MRIRSKFTSAGVAFLSLAIVAPAALTAPARAAADIKIGVITATSGGLKSYGDAYNAAFDWGLNYYTKGTMMINGAKLVVTKKDDGGLPDAATAAFKDMVGNGTKIIVGTASSAVALTLAPLAAQNKVLYISGPAKNDAVVNAANKYVFRSGNNSSQDLAPLAGISPIKGKKVVLFVEDNAFGAGNIFAAESLLGPKGAVFQEIKVATTATDFTPYAKKAADANAAYTFIAWSNALTAGGVFTALKQQGAFAHSRPITGLAGVASYDIYGTIFDGTNAILTNSYFPGVFASAAASDLGNAYAKNNQTQDLFTPTGADAARMVVRALTGNAGVNIDTAITNLEGYTWLGVKGRMLISATTHQLVQPMFLVSLTKSGAHYTPHLLRTIYNVGQ